MKTGVVTIKVDGEMDGEHILPSNIDVNFIAESIVLIQDLLYPNKRSDHRPKITYTLTEGCVSQGFGVPILKQIEFEGILNGLNNGVITLGDLDKKTAAAFDRVQKLAKKKGLRYEFSSGAEIMTIGNDSDFYLPEPIWSETEIFLYGIIQDWGGLNKANIHISSEEYGLVTVKTDKDFILSQKDNLVYRPVALRCMGKQDAHFGHLVEGSLRLVELMDFDPVVDDDYLDQCISRAEESWKGVKVEEWLNDLRGYGE